MKLVKQKIPLALSASILIITLILIHVWITKPVIAQTSNEVKELNLYSARHYQTDEALYSDFTKKTGIKINRIEADTMP